MTALTIRHLDRPDSLYCQYDGQTSQQSCYLELDLEDGTFGADYNAEIGTGIPVSVYHRRTLRYTIPCLTSDAANALVDELSSLAQRVLDGAEIDWNGSDRVGILNTEAEAAHEQIMTRCDGYNFDDRDLVMALDAADWFEELPKVLTADTTDAELDTMAMEENREATTAGMAGYIILNGTLGYLEGEREELREALRDELEDLAARVAELGERRNELIRRQSAWGDSDRAVGERAGLSHTAVRQIRNRNGS